MKKRMTIMLIVMGIIFGLILFYKVLMVILMKRFFANYENIISVSTMTVQMEPWETKLTAAGSVRAIKGISVTTELSGMVQTIYFTPGSIVEKGTVLVQLNADTEIAALEALKANAELARITYERDKAQFAIKGISKQTLDSDYQNLQSLKAQVLQQKAIVDKKTIIAPFSGRLGISAVNPGQFLNPGDKVVTLQMLDPIYVDFYLPQQTLAVIKVDMPVVVTTDTFPGMQFKGKITTIDPAVDVSTRNVPVEATVANPDHKLFPGMFTYVQTNVGKPKDYITVPQTAIAYNSFGNIVYIIREKGKDKNGKPMMIANQKFVKTGATRGDQIAIESGLNVGDVIVTGGQLKLKNGARVSINNAIQPPNNPAPDTPDEH